MTAWGHKLKVSISSAEITTQKSGKKSGHLSERKTTQKSEI
jgi:hypothetical protein